MKRKKHAIHARIRELREGLGLSQAEFARRVGSDKTAIWHWENGDYWPNRELMPKVAAVLGVTLDELYSEAAA